MADRERMTVSQAAEALGVSDDAIRRGLAGKWPLADLLRDAGSRDSSGRWMIELTAAEVERHRMPLQRHRQLTPPEAPLGPLAEGEAAPIRDMAEAAAAAHAAELERLKAAHAAELGRLRADIDQGRAERDAAAADAAGERDRAEGALIRAAAAEAETKGLREALAKARRPFWRRWIG